MAKMASPEVDFKSCLELPSTRMQQICIIPVGAAFDPRDYMDLIESLGHTRITQDQDLLFQLAQHLASQLANWAESALGKLPSPIQRYIELILSTRCQLEGNLELDQRLVTAASNAISVLNYAYQVGLIEFQLGDVANFSHCRVPYANFNMSSLSGCNFDHADLSEASFYETFLRGASFRCANLRQATTYSVEPLAKGAATWWKSVEVAPSEKWFAVVTTKGEKVLLQFRDIVTADLIRELDLPAEDENTYYSLAISPDSQHLALSNTTPLTYVWEVATGKLLHELGPHPSGVECVAYHPEGGYIATGTADGTVHLWELSKGDCPKCKWTANVTDTPIRRIAFSADGKLLAELTTPGDVHIRDSETQKVVLAFKGPDDYCRAENLVFSPDARYLAIQTDSRIEIRDLDSNPDEPIFLRYLKGISDLLQPTAERDSLVSHFASTGIDVWKFVSHVIGGYAKFFNNGQRVIMSQNSIQHVTALTWRTKCGLHRNDEVRPLRIGVHSNANPISLSPNGLTLLILGGRHFPQVSSYSRLTLANSRTLECLLHMVCPDTIQRVGWSSDSTLLLSAETIIYVLDLRSREIVHVIGDPSRVALALKRLSTFSSPLKVGILPEERLTITNVKLSASPIPVPSRHNGNLIAFVLGDDSGLPTGIGLMHPDGANVGNITTLRLPYTDDTKEARVLNQPSALCFSHDDRYLAALLRGGDICVWEIATQSLVLIGELEKKKNAGTNRPKQQLLDFSPDDRFIAAVGSDNEVWVWDMQSKNVKLRLSGHSLPIGTVTWSSNGRMIASAGADVIRLWDAETGECVACLRETGRVKAMIWSDESKALITVDEVAAVVQRWRLRVLRRKQPLADGGHWKVRTNLERTRWFTVSNGVMEANFEDAKLNPALDRAITMSVSSYYRGIPLEEMPFTNKDPEAGVDDEGYDEL